jgi:hypothetical protein
METNFTSETWEQSLAQVQKVNPRPELFNRIQNSIHAHEKVSNVTVWLVAASLIALVAVNFLILQNKTTKSETKMTYMEASLNQSNQLYH